MTAGTTPQFEIPADMRKMSEQSMNQVKAAINAYLDFWKRSVPENVVGGSALSDKILANAEKNVASAFEFAGRLAQVRDVQEIAKLQMDFIQAQMQAMTEQAKNLSEIAMKAITDGLKSPSGGGLSS